MTHGQSASEPAPGGPPAGRRKRVIALVTYLILIALLIIVIAVLHAPPGWQAVAAVVVAGVGALALRSASPDGLNALGAGVAVVGLVATYALTTQESQTAHRPQPTAPALCPHTQEPMALVPADDPVPQGNPSTMSGLGAAHIDNVIALDGSADIQGSVGVHKFETVCLTVFKYPAAGRQLWLIQRLRVQDDDGTYYNLFYVVGALSDPSPVRYYGVPVDGICNAQATGDRHTFFIVSAPASAASELWANYTARLNSLNTDCNPEYDTHRRSLPAGYYIVSEESDVILH
jgi:hypothetical protein